MQYLCARVIPYLIGASCAVELDRVVDLQTLQVPVAVVVVLCGVGMLIPNKRSA
jgi:hypothetical protein